jgi:hypothetical protein
MSDIREVLARLERVETELALRRAAQQYCVAGDLRDLELWRGVWTPDAVWELSPEMVFTGIDAICETVERQWQMFPTMQHATVNLDVDVEAATGRSDVIVHIQLQDTTWVTGGATYLDEFRRHEGAWRIARRRVTRTFNIGPIPTWEPAAER